MQKWQDKSVLFFGWILKSALTFLRAPPSRDGAFHPIRQLALRETGRLHKLGLIGTNSIAATESQQAWVQFGQKLYKCQLEY